MTDFSMLRALCSTHAPSGNEGGLTAFLLKHIDEVRSTWKTQPRILSGNGFQDCIVLIFGKPRLAVYAHIDNIGYTVRYGQELVPIGSPHAGHGALLWGDDGGIPYECQLAVDGDTLSFRGKQTLPTGTTLSFRPDWREDNQSIQCCYMDNRLGVWTALQLCQTMEDGAIVFSCWEEHGGGSASFLGRYLFEEYRITQALICDITWATEGVQPGHGVAISLRDSRIPRRSYIDKIVTLAKQSGISYQLEVERSGGSDGAELQKLPYPIDWCFIGAPEEHVHTPDEKVHKVDIDAMVRMYRYLLEKME